MLLILSAQIVGEDIALNYGKIPPTFLPMGNQRLFSVQAELSFSEPCYMTIPDCFMIPRTDRNEIEKKGIVLLSQPRGLSLTAALRDALVRTSGIDGPLRILYGDTLVRMPIELMQKPDMVAVQNTTANYTWAFVETEVGGRVEFSDDPPRRLDIRRVVCGYYNFADRDLLVDACEQDNIVKALNFYNAKRPLVCCDADSWLDFGHLPLYFQSRKDIQVKRVFNELDYEDQMLVKHSADTAKMRAEAHWYENIPDSLKLHVPRYGGRIERNQRAGYGIEYLFTPLLSDLAAFGALPLASWLEIIQACFEFFEKCHNIRPSLGAPEASPKFATSFYQSMIVDKTWSCLKHYGVQSGITLHHELNLNEVQYPPLSTVVEQLIESVPPTQPEHICFWHGDLFFGNMFYDFTARRILCIDPRGQLSGGEQSLYGDFRYDLAKLAHSIIGQYDKVLHGRSVLYENGTNRWTFIIDEQPQQKEIERIFTRFAKERCGIDEREMLALTALLFLSMLPLHDDRPDLQRHFLAIGVQLYGKMPDREAM